MEDVAKGSQAASQSILVVGDFMLDVWWEGTVSRISPEAPVPVVKITAKKSFPGGAGNVAENVEGLGGRAVVPPQVCSPITKHRLVVGGVQLARWDEDDEGKGLEGLEGLTADKAIIADYGKGSITPEVVERVWTMKIPTFIDTKLDPTPYVGWVTAIFPNAAEYTQFSAAYNRFERCIVTMGADGAKWLRFGEEVDYVPAFRPASEVVSVAGAGDTFTVAYALRWPGKAPLQFASLTAAVVVGKSYTSVATQAEVHSLARRLKKRAKK